MPFGRQFELETALDYFEASLGDLFMLWYSSEFVFYTFLYCLHCFRIGFCDCSGPGGSSHCNVCV